MLKKRKYPEMFQDWAMQKLYEALRTLNYADKDARTQVITRFSEYDNC